MAGVRCAWDRRKNLANERKHGIPFQEAETVFADEHALLLDDPEHSEGEERFVLIGLSVALRALVVCRCYRERDDLIRLISARRATRLEREQYSRRWRE